MTTDADPDREAAPTPRVWFLLSSVHLDGAQAVRRSTATRTPSRGVAVSH